MHIAITFSLSDIDDRTLVEARFWSLIDRRGPDECWPWLGGKRNTGYGQMTISINGRMKNISTHRLSYVLEHGMLPEHPLVVRHKVCGNRACCNPAHLDAGTVRDNTDDTRRMGRVACGERAGVYTHPESRPYGERNGAYTKPHRRRRGSQNGRTKLTETAVQDILRRLADGETHDAIAQRYGVWSGTITSIANGQTWSHISGLVPQRPGHPVGARHGMAKLSDEQVHGILQALASGEDRKMIAERYGTTRPVINKIAAGRSWQHLSGLARPGLPRGERVGTSVLSEPQVRDILALLAEHVPERRIAKMFGVSRGAITGIARGTNWKHVARPIPTQEPDVFGVYPIER